MSMASTFFKSFSKAAKNKSAITIYHNTNSKASHQLLSRLNAYSQMPNTTGIWANAKSPMTKKFLVDIKLNQKLRYEDYLYMMNDCVDMHPDNKAIVLKIHDLKHSFHNMEVLTPQEFEKSIQEMGPLVIDNDNHLLANDEKSFDRIMANYLTCGIQNSHNLGKLEPPRMFITEAQPHVAEFADLY